MNSYKFSGIGFRARAMQDDFFCLASSTDMSITTPVTYPFLTKEEQAMTRSTVAAITRSGHFHLESNGSVYALPPYAAQKVVGLLDLLAEGQDVSIPPAQAEVSIAQAAKFLDMSEACVHEVLGLGVLEYRQDGNQYWIDRDSLMEYDADCRRMSEGLKEIIRLSEEMGLYDDE